MKVVYFGNNLFSLCLKYLISEGHKIVKVFVNFPEDNCSIITSLCNLHSIPVESYKPTLTELNDLIFSGAEMFLAAEYSYLIPQTNVKYAINIHPTLLPMGRGPTPLPNLIRKTESSGVSIHKLTSIFDGGDVILQTKIPVLCDESITTLMVKIQIESLKLIEILFLDIDRYYDKGTPQTTYSYWPKIEVLARVLDWSLPTNNIKLLIRSFGFFGLVVKLNNVFWKVVHAEAIEYDHDYLPGIVIFEDNQLLVISSSDGMVCLHKASLSLITN